jgi:formylglycine-generating enzyme required for sulfatase activity
VEDLTATARQHEQNGELDQAIAIWDHIVALDPESQKAPEIRKKLGTELTAAKDFIAKAQQEVETRDWGKALHQWEKALKLWPACPEAQNGRDQAAQQLEQFKQLFAQTKQLAKEHRLTSALETHRQALGIGISDEALELQDQMESAHQQAEVMSQAGTGAAGQSLWREAAAKLQSAWALNRESVNEGELDKARKLAAKVQTHLDKSQALLKDGYFQDAEAEAQKGLEYGPDLKLQEVASESGRRSQRVQEAVNEAEECEPQNPPQAVKLWQEVLSLQPVHAVAPERIRKLQERIGNAQQKFDEARNWEAKKKWAKMLLAGQEAQAINPAIPDISAFIQRASSNYRKQKIILATATAAAILVIIAVTTKATIESFNSKSYEKWMGEGKAKLASEDWSAAQAAFGKAKTAFVFAKQDKGKLAGGLETLASGIVEADKQVTQAKKLADTQEKDWKKVAEAYERARGSLKGIDLKPVAELQKWLQKWETEEYQASDKYCESLQAPKTRAEILGTFLKSHPEAKNRKSVETRIKNYLQEHFDTSYQGLADRFEQDFLFKEKEKDCQEMLEQLKKLVEEARKDGITIRIPPHRTIAVLTETFAKADQVRAIKQAVQRAKAAFKQAQTPKDKIAVWAGFRTQYPGQEAETILGEIADEYNSLVRRFEGILAKDEAVFGMAEAVEAATASSLASALVDEATKAAFNFTIANPESKPDALAQRIAPKKAAVEDKAFGTANADAQAAKTPQEKIEVWEKFLTSFPKNLFGKHYRDALQSKYEPHVEICTKAMETSDFAEADKELSKAEALFKQAEEGGMALTVLPEKQPAILREKLDYSIAKAGAAKAADPFAEIAAWEKYLQAQPSSSQAPQARQARQKAYTAAYSSLLKSFDENLKKKTDQGFAQAEKDKETAQTLLQKAVAAKYDPKSIASDRTPDNLQTDWTSAKNAFEEETAFTAATTSANEQLKSQKFDDAISTWEGFIAKKYPPGNFSDKAKAELNKARQAAVDSYVAEGQKAFASNKLSDAYKQVQNALRYLPDARNALDLQKQIIPKLILASGVFEIPTEDKDPFGNPAMKGEDDKTGYPREIRHKNSQMLFIFVPAGEFMMGDPKNADGDNPQHPVSISKPFYLGKYEVTLKEIKVFDKADNNSLTQDVTRRQEESDKTAKAMKQDPISISSWLNPGFKQEDSHPAVHITLAYIDKFLKWMNRDYGKELFQLPTEAQWEYACRAGSTTEFFWGDDEEAGAQCANFKGNSTQPVGSKKPNAFGLYDVIGNAMEWCQDWYDGNFYASSPKNEPICQQKTDNRACRGGAFADRGKRIRPAYRNKNKPTCDSNTMGFRLCIDASATTEKSTVFAAGSK